MEFDSWLTPNLNGSHFQKFVETPISNYSLCLACTASNARYVTYDFKLIVALSFRLQKSLWNGKRRYQGWPTDRIVAVRREKCPKQGKTEHRTSSEQGRGVVAWTRWQNSLAADWLEKSHHQSYACSDSRKKGQRPVGDQIQAAIQQQWVGLQDIQREGKRQGENGCCLNSITQSRSAYIFRTEVARGKWTANQLEAVWSPGPLWLNIIG